jgi:predicted enzyme related to lactoylglutathione lyase
MSRPLVWFEAVGQHAATLEGFYEEVLGWHFDTRRPTPRPLPTRGWRLWRPARKPAPPPWWVSFYTPVPDLERAVAKARALGSRVLVPPTRHGDSVIAVVSDPEGHPLGLCT